MKMKTLKRLTAVMCAAMMMSGGSLTVFAAPKTMSDGQTFDAEFYAETYPDVVAALGSSESALYSHYVNYGKAEGRLPYADAQPQSTNTTGIPKGVTINYWTDCKDLGNGNYLQLPLQFEVVSENGATYQVTDKDIIEIAKEIAPNGTEWGLETYYDTLSTKRNGLVKRGNACLGFAYWLTDAIYGNAPMVKYDASNTDKAGFEYNMYDIIILPGTSADTFHAGVVIGADAATQTLYIAEGNLNGVVNWNRAIKISDVDIKGVIRRVY